MVVVDVEIAGVVLLPCVRAVISLIVGDLTLVCARPPAQAWPCS
jgi:hypothetical protein